MENMVGDYLLFIRWMDFALLISYSHLVGSKINNLIKAMEVKISAIKIENVWFVGALWKWSWLLSQNTERRK